MTAATFTLPPGLDAPPNDDRAPDYDGNARQLGALTCENPDCDTVLSYSGRGRKPRFCDEHKKGSKTADGGSTRRQSSAQLDVIERQLVTYFNMAAAGCAFMGEKGKLDGVVLRLYGPNIAHELVELSKTNRDLRKWLTFISQPGKYGPLVLATLPLTIAIMANHGLIPTLGIPRTDAGTFTDTTTGG